MAVETFLPDDDCVALTGSGGTAPSLALLVRPRSAPEAARSVLGRGARGVVARGRGGACGDAAQNAGGTVLDLTGLDRIQGLDPREGVVVCEAGTGLDRLARALLPHGWQPPLDLVAGPRPARRRAGTVGGAISRGDLTGAVRSLELLTADGAVTTVRPGDPLCDATTGGLGLTGVILSVALALRPVETAYVRERSLRFRDADALLAHWTGADPPRGRHARAWVELSGRGRAVLTTAEPVPYAGLPRGHRARRAPLGLPSGRGPAGGLRPLPGLTRTRPLTPYGPGASGGLPAAPGSALLPRFLASLGRSGVVPVPGLPGPFVRYRCAVPEGREEALRGILGLLAHRRSPARGARHARVERVDADGTGPLAFPLRGWCLELDVPAGAPGLGRFLDVLDERVTAAGGRVCLAEDARLRPALLPVMYPRLDAFRELRASADPRSVFRSDLSRRLGL
ncbi:FAD-binding protein [Streptomyces sp. NPDC085460]|uniref:FAD-binding protein n=1 Tax=Streptomyces sp. NPDC085460 TaxID=3365723 RepID=UPI0037D97631